MLIGARMMLERAILAAVVEVEFQPFYKGQRLFGDVCELLGTHGFQFVRFVHRHRFTPFRAPLGLRGRGFDGSADALFFKHPDRIDGGGDALRTYIQLRKLAFLSFVFDHAEYAWECLARSRALGVLHVSDTLAARRYEQFLREIERATSALPVLFPKSFAETYTSEDRLKRFESGEQLHRRLKGRRAMWATRGLDGLRRLGPLYACARGGKRAAVRMAQAIGRWKARSRVGRRLGSGLFSRYSTIERIFLRYGLRSHARLLRASRLQQSGYVDGVPTARRKQGGPG